MTCCDSFCFLASFPPLPALTITNLGILYNSQNAPLQKTNMLHSGVVKCKTFSKPEPVPWLCLGLFSAYVDAETSLCVSSVINFFF